METKPLAGTRVGVTGATGFLGRYIVRALHDRGARVVGVVRNPERGADLARLGIEFRRADLADRAALAASFEGLDAVVSNAALFQLRGLISRDPNRWGVYEQANIDGTRNVYEAMRQAGVRRAVQVSSVAVYNRRRQPVVDEEHPVLGPDTPRTPRNAYSLSKAISERLARELSATYDIALTVVRPSGIFGARDPNFTPIFRRLVQFPVTVMPIGLRLGLVYGGDVADGIARALERPNSAARVYNLAGGDETFYQMVRAWKKAGGKTGLLALPIPAPVRMLYSTARAQAELGWQRRPLEEAFRDMFRIEAAIGGG